MILGGFHFDSNMTLGDVVATLRRHRDVEERQTGISSPASIYLSIAISLLLRPEFVVFEGSPLSTAQELMYTYEGLWRQLELPDRLRPSLRLGDAASRKQNWGWSDEVPFVDIKEVHFKRGSKWNRFGWSVDWFRDKGFEHGEP